MSVTNAIPSQVTNSPRPKSQPGGANPSTDYQMFLKMLTTQMKNQDPLNPIESSDYAVQLATFSGVEQQVKTNDLLVALTGQLGVTSMGQYAAWVGMEARAPMPAAYNGTPLTLYPAPAAGAERTVLVAYDAQNHEMMRQEIAVSADPVRWTGHTATGGQLLPGNYTFKLESYVGGEMKTAEPVEMFGKITEVRQGPTGPVLVTASGGTVTPSQVKALRPLATP
ncbi:MAG: flagellar hook assembly protein FlgD [Rhodobacteraceae bacterium]|nr:flagellar hook assembly protein FlgD [Paracoccaceae bacterium]